MEKTCLFYDIETTGLNPCFDQVLEFAAIRTDMELRELERHDIKVKLNSDVLPSPAAVITHRIGVSKSQNGLSELDAVIRIHQLLNTPGTISLGYNTMGFDDEFLRFSFYRNLLPAYTHQYANHCSRMDLYPLTAMYYLFKPHILAEWPKSNGDISLKLANLSEANELAKGQAHTAMVDVEATLALARRFIRERSTWDYLTGYFDQHIDQARMSQLTEFEVEKFRFQEALLLDGKFGAKKNFLAPVLNLGQHHQYAKQTLWLRLDMENLTQTTLENIPQHTFVIRKKTGEKEFLLPPKSRYLTKLSLERQQLAQSNKIWLSEHSGLLTAICDYHRQFVYPKIPSIDASAALYDLDFTSRAEENLFQKFHRSPAEKKMQVAHQFPNTVHRELALRIVGRHFFDCLTPQDQKKYHEYTQRALYTQDSGSMDYRGQSRLNIYSALTELSTLKNTALSIEQQQLLNELEIWFKNEKTNL